MATQEEIASMSIEQIEAEALRKLNGEGGDETPAVDNAEGDPLLDAGEAEGKTDVAAESSTAQQATEEQPQKKESDKEVNFIHLRTKVRKTEEELQEALKKIQQLESRGVFTAELPDDHAQRMEAVSAEIGEIDSKYQSGDITWEERQQLSREANARREALLEEALLHKVSMKMREAADKESAEQASMTWEQTVNSFMEKKPDGVDYSSDAVKNRDLNTYVKALAADPDNADRDFDWFITEAHSLVKAKHKITATAPSKQLDDTGVEHQSNDLPFNSLSDLPGGAMPARNQIEEVSDVSGAALANKFMNDPALIDKYLASLG